MIPCFECGSPECNSVECIKINEIVNKFSLAGDNLMPEMHLKQLGFTYSACEPLTKNKERIQKLKKTGDIKYIHKNKLDKAYFQHDMTYGGFKELAKRTASDEFLRVKTFNIAKYLKYERYPRGLASMVYKFSDKKSACSGVNTHTNKSAFKKQV